MISVIMPIYNEKWDWIYRSIRSIINQSYNNLQLVVVVDNPNFLYVERLEQLLFDSNIKYRIEKNKSNMGLVASLNVGVSLSNGEFIARMDSDDIAFPERFEKELSFLKKNKLDFVSSAIQQIDTEGKQLKIITSNRDLLNRDIVKIERWQNIFWHPTWLMKRSVFNSLKQYREVRSAEDYDFVIRALLKGFKLGQVKDVLVYKRINDMSISAENELNQILIAQKLAWNFRKKKVSDLAELAVNVTEGEKRKFAYIRKSFNERSSKKVVAEFVLLGQFIATPMGRLFFKSILIQKYQVPLVTCVH